MRSKFYGCLLLAAGILLPSHAFAQSANAPVAPQATGAPQANVQSSPGSTPDSGAAAAQGQILMNLLSSYDLYHPETDVKGSARLSGSMTMVLLGKAWSERFRQFHKEVVFERGPDGTAKSIQELANDPTLIVGSSRPLTTAEMDQLKAGNCKDPISIIVALDPMAVYVNEANPLATLTPEQLEGIIRAAGQQGPHFGTWGEVGVTGELADKPIRIHSRSEQSGTKAFIKQFILRGDELAPDAESHRSSQEICDAVANDVAAIGVGTFSDAKPGIRAVPLTFRGQTVAPTEENFLAGQYPFVRPLVLVFDKAQMANDGGLREAMIRYILSRDGQLEAIRAGFFPLSPSFVHKQLDELCGPRMR